MQKFLIVFLFFCLPQAQAAIQIESSRIIYAGNAKSASVKINNFSEDNYIVQTWLDKNEKEKDKNLPMVVTPPLVKLRPEQSAILRFIYSGQGLPDDRESVFWVNIQEIPPASKQENVLQLAIRTRLKLFYRPTRLKADLAQEARNLSWDIKDNKLILVNNGPLHITLTSVLMRDKNGKTFTVNVPMISSFSKESVTVFSQARMATMSFINDYGAVSPLYPASK